MLVKNYKENKICVCGATMTLYVNVTGGCCNNEFCYCDLPDAYVYAECPDWCKKGKHSERFKVAGMTDQYGIARVLNELYSQ